MGALLSWLFGDDEMDTVTVTQGPYIPQRSREQVLLSTGTGEDFKEYLGDKGDILDAESAADLEELDDFIEEAQAAIDTYENDPTDKNRRFAMTKAYVVVKLLDELRGKVGPNRLKPYIEAKNDIQAWWSKPK